MRLLQPTLNYGSRSKTLEFVSSAPERPAQLMLLQVRCDAPTPINPGYLVNAQQLTSAFESSGTELAAEAGGLPAVFGVQRAGAERSPAAAQLCPTQRPAQ